MLSALNNTKNSTLSLQKLSRSDRPFKGTQNFNEIKAISLPYY